MPAPSRAANTNTDTGDARRRFRLPKSLAETARDFSHSRSSRRHPTRRRLPRPARAPRHRRQTMSASGGRQSAQAAAQRSSSWIGIEFDVEDDRGLFGTDAAEIADALRKLTLLQIPQPAHVVALHLNGD